MNASTEKFHASWKASGRWRFGVRHSCECVPGWVPRQSDHILKTPVARGSTVSHGDWFAVNCESQLAAVVTLFPHTSGPPDGVRQYAVARDRVAPKKQRFPARLQASITRGTAGSQQMALKLPKAYETEIYIAQGGYVAIK